MPRCPRRRCRGCCRARSTAWCGCPSPRTARAACCGRSCRCAGKCTYCPSWSGQSVSYYLLFSLSAFKWSSPSDNTWSPSHRHTHHYPSHSSRPGVVWLWWWSWLLLLLWWWWFSVFSFSFLSCNISHFSLHCTFLCNNFCSDFLTLFYIFLCLNILCSKIAKDYILIFSSWHQDHSSWQQGHSFSLLCHVWVWIWIFFWFWVFVCFWVWFWTSVCFSNSVCFSYFY